MRMVSYHIAIRDPLQPWNCWLCRETEELST